MIQIDFNQDGSDKECVRERCKKEYPGYQIVELENKIIILSKVTEEKNVEEEIIDDKSEIYIDEMHFLSDISYNDYSTVAFVSKFSNNVKLTVLRNPGGYIDKYFTLKDENIKNDC